MSNLLSFDEKVVELNLGGWIRLGNQLSVGDDIIIDYGTNYFPRLFDRPVRATVRGISINNLLAITLHTSGAKDSYGYEWSVGDIDGWLDIKWFIKRIVKRDV